jgi:hypothetical protein
LVSAQFLAIGLAAVVAPASAAAIPDCAVGQDAPDGAPKDLLVWVQHSRLEESFEAGMARSPGSNQSVMESRDTNDYYC